MAGDCHDKQIMRPGPAQVGYKGVPQIMEGEALDPCQFAGYLKSHSDS